MTAPHDAPTAEELLRSVRDWLEKDVAPGLSGSARFHARVALNIIDIVAREWELGPEQQSRHADVMSSLGVVDDAELAIRIREGAFDDDLASLLITLRPVVEDKVRVANPRYLA